MHKSEYNRYDKGRGDIARLDDRVEICNLENTVEGLEGEKGELSGWHNETFGSAIVILDRGELIGKKAIVIPVVCLRKIKETPYFYETRSNIYVFRDLNTFRKVYNMPRHTALLSSAIFSMVVTDPTYKFGDVLKDRAGIFIPIGLDKNIKISLFKEIIEQYAKNNTI